MMTNRRGFLGRLLGAAVAAVAARVLPPPAAVVADDVAWPMIRDGTVTLANGDDMMIEWNTEGVMRVGLYRAGEDIPRDVPITVERNGAGYDVVRFRG